MVRFIRLDGRPDEEYYYSNRGDAEYHFNLFLNDDSNLYKSISLLALNSEEDIISKIQFDI